MARIYRDGVNPLGGMMEVNADVANVVGSGTMMAWDFPNIASAANCLYAAKFFATGGSDILRWNPTALPLQMTIDEIMG